MTDKLPAKVENTSSGGLTVSNDLFSDNAGAGFENVTSEDMLIPRLAILQALSPQVNKSKSDHIKGAEVGYIADVGLGEIFPDGLDFVPVYYRKEYLEWAPRETGKGLQGIHPSADILKNCTKNEQGRMVLPNGNYIVETAQFYGMNMSANRRWCFIPMTSTQLKKARKWLTLATAERLKRGDGSEYVAPLFYRVYQLSSAHETNNKGEWEGWIVNRGQTIVEAYPDEWQNIGREAVSMRDVIMSGKAQADLSEDDSGPVEDAM